MISTTMAIFVYMRTVRTNIYNQNLDTRFLYPKGAAFYRTELFVGLREDGSELEGSS